MTREEQIRQAEDAAYGNNTCRAAAHFEAGARWADANPSPETIQRIVTFYKLWYTTESTTGMVDYIKQHLKS